MKLPAAVLAVLAVPATAQADRRSLTHTSEYLTLPESETELELYSQVSRPSRDGSAGDTFQLELEVEHGLSAKWEVALRHVFTQTSGAVPEQDQAFGLDELQLDCRRRFAEHGEWPVDVAVFGHVARSFRDPIWAGEARVIVTRDFDKLRFAANLVGDVAFGPAIDEPEVRAGWAGGLTYELFPEIKVGAEAWGDLDVESRGAVTASAGPAVSWAPTTNLWLATTAGFALTEYADELEIRAAVGLHL